MSTINNFWQEFLTVTNQDQSVTYTDSFHFYPEHLANELLSLVLSGKKTATTASFLAYELEGEKLPQVGDYAIVTDLDGQPHCVIETTAVTLMPFKEMTFDICKREGEDDTLESWRQGHERVFREEGKQVGYEFSEDMPIVFTDFKVVWEKQ